MADENGLEGEGVAMAWRAISRQRPSGGLGGGERCVCELTAELGLAQSKLSFHLKVMKEAGLIEAREEGRWTYYQLQPELLGQLGAWLASLACQASRIQALTCANS